MAAREEAEGAAATAATGGKRARCGDGKHDDRHRRGRLFLFLALQRASAGLFAVAAAQRGSGGGRLPNARFRFRDGSPLPPRVAPSSGNDRRRGGHGVGATRSESGYEGRWDGRWGCGDGLHAFPRSPVARPSEAETQCTPRAGERFKRWRGGRRGGGGGIAGVELFFARHDAFSPHAVPDASFLLFFCLGVGFRAPAPPGGAPIVGGAERWKRRRER